MRIKETQSTAQAVHFVASTIIDKVSSNPKSIIGLATGKTMVPVYADLIKLAKKKKISFKDCFFFMLDEYMELPLNHPASFRNYIQNHLIQPLGLKDSQFSFPPVNLKNGASYYEEILKEKGGIDLQLLGLGRNGHVGFNEPGSLKNSRTRIVKLSEDTLEANCDEFKDMIPTHALSMGIETILECKELLMLATGKSKAQIVKYLINHHNDKECPATYLKLHSHFTLVLDPEAASRINLNI